MKCEDSTKDFTIMEQTPKLRKRKPKKALTLAERVAVIKQYSEIRNTRKMAVLFGCGRTQIQNILKRKEEYLAEWTNNGDPNRIRSRNSDRLLTLGGIVYEWVQRSRSHGLELNDDHIRRSAQHVARLLVMPEFRATNTWIDRFKKKYKLFDLDRNQCLEDFSSPRKSLKIDDIIQDLRDSESKNFPTLQKTLPFDSLEDYTSNDVTETTNYTICLDDKEMVVKNESYQNESDCVSLSSESSHALGVDNSSDFVQDYAVIEMHEEQEVFANHISSYKEALNHLGPLEQFALLKEDVRATGLINQLENLFREKMSLSNS